MIAKSRANDLQNALKRIIPFTSKDEIRPVLMHILFDACSEDGGKLTLVGANGFQMGVAEISADVDEDFQTLIRADQVRGLAQGGPIGEFNGLDFVVEGKKRSVGDMTFPDYQKILPSKHKVHCVLPNGFMEAVSNLRAVAKPLYRHHSINSVFWHISRDGHVLELIDEDEGRSVRHDFCVKGGISGFEADEPGLVVTIDIRLLDEIVRATGMEDVTCKVLAANAPVMFERDEPDYKRFFKWLVMPTHEPQREVKSPGQ